MPTFGRPEQRHPAQPALGERSPTADHRRQHREHGVEQVSARRARAAPRPGTARRARGDHSAAASASARRSSTLLAASITGLPDGAATGRPPRRCRSPRRSRRRRTSRRRPARSATSACSATRTCEPPDVALPAPGVDQPNRRPAQSASYVTRSRVTPGHVLHDGLAPAEHPVDQGRLADVRPADDGQHGQRAGRPAVVEPRRRQRRGAPDVLGAELVLLQSRPQSADPGRPGWLSGVRERVPGRSVTAQAPCRPAPHRFTRPSTRASSTSEVFSHQVRTVDLGVLGDRPRSPRHGLLEVEAGGVEPQHAVGGARGTGDGASRRRPGARPGRGWPPPPARRPSRAPRGRGGPAARSSLAVSRIRTSASGATTVVMSRPSATTPPAALGARLDQSRWRRRSSARTPRLVATVLTAAEIRVSRIVGGRCPARRPGRTGASGSVPISRSQVAGHVRRLRPRRRGRRPAPGRPSRPRDTSRRCRGTPEPSRRPRSGSTVDLPDPDGPSMATTSGRRDASGCEPGTADLQDRSGTAANLHSLVAQRPLRVHRTRSATRWRRCRPGLGHDVPAGRRQRRLEVLPRGGQHGDLQQPDRPARRCSRASSSTLVPASRCRRRPGRGRPVRPG